MPPLRKEKQTVISKNHDKKCFKVKNVEVSEDEDLLKQLNDALLEEVKANKESIENLKKKEKKYLNDIKDLNKNISGLENKLMPELRPNLLI